MSKNDDEVLVRVEGVSKKFCRSLKKSLWYGVCDIAGELLPGRKRRETRDEGRELSDRSAQDISHSPLDAGLSTSAITSSDSRLLASGRSTLDSSCSAKALDSGPSTLDSTHGLRAGEFFAVKDVSFELRRGECLGLIGHNGAGKTTLLKMLNGLIKPDAGSITMRGRVGALIALGAGFNPILTGRENIYINGSVLGLTKKEIDEKIDEIIDFAEIREFIDMSVQSYSSGMTVRLGFAVASNLSPDVLILDEVLAVGDMAFQAKCLNTLGNLRATGTAFILVSHNMLNISRYCSHVLFVSRGKKKYFGPTDAGIKCYEEEMQDVGSQVEKSTTEGDFTGSGRLQMQNIAFYDFNGNLLDKLQPGGHLKIKVCYSKNCPELLHTKLEVTIRDRDGVLHRFSGGEVFEVSGDVGGTGIFECDFPMLPINSSMAKFSFVLWDRDCKEIYDWKKDFVIECEVIPQSVGRVFCIHTIQHHFA